MPIYPKLTEPPMVAPGEQQIISLATSFEARER